MNSSWADPKNLKNSLNGVGAGISWKAKWYKITNLFKI